MERKKTLKKKENWYIKYVALGLEPCYLSVLTSICYRDGGGKTNQKNRCIRGFEHVPSCFQSVRASQ